jgi:hypothetical protein
MEGERVRDRDRDTEREAGRGREGVRQRDGDTDSETGRGKAKDDAQFLSHAPPPGFVRVTQGRQKMRAKAT